MKGITLPRLDTIAISGILAAVFLSSIKPIANLDIWWHLASGRYMLSNYIIPRHDIFSFTALGKPWIDHAWLTQIIFYSTYNRFSYWGLILIKCVLVVSIFSLLFKRLSLSSDRATTVVFMVLLFGATNRFILLRPFLFTWLFVAFFVYVLDLYMEYRINEKSLVILPIITLFWANLHGGFILGIVLLMIYAVGSLLQGDRNRSKKLFYIALACAATSLLNPYTYHLFLYPFQYASETVHAKFIAEWQSPSFHTFGFYEALLLITIASLAAYGGSVNPIDALLLLIFVHLSLFSIRNIPLFAIVCGPVIAKYSEAALLSGLGSLVGKDFKDVGSGLLEATLWKLNEKLKLKDGDVKVFINRSVPAFLWTAVLFSTFLFAYSYSTSEDAFQTGPSPTFPDAAASFLLTSNLEGNLYNSYGWGGYLIWRLYPDYKVFIDGRADIYGEFAYEYLKVSWIKPEILETLENYNISIIFIPKEQALNVFLRESPSWKVEYEDDIAAIYVRDLE